MNNKSKLIDRPYTSNYKNRVAQFQEDQNKLVAPVKPIVNKKTSGVISKKSSCTETNPYFQARQKLLTQYPPWKREEIESMEKTGIFSRFYDEFINEIIIMAESTVQCQ
jgi:hypothetical protein